MKSLSFFRRSRAALATLIAALAVPAQADLILNSSLTVVNDGHVFATFLGYSASYSNDLFLQSPAGPGGVLFNNKSTPVGTTVDLGYFTAGTELIFGLHVNNAGYTFYSGDASLNPDGVAHSAIFGTWQTTGLIVGFEDLFGGGDKDYNDLIFGFKNVAAGLSGPGGRVPDAGSTAALLGAALLGVSALRRRFRQ
jgi:hypothetical protein